MSLKRTAVISTYLVYWLKPCPHCRRKVRLLQKSATVAEFRRCLAVFCDSRTFLRQCGQGFNTPVIGDLVWRCRAVVLCLVDSTTPVACDIEPIAAWSSYSRCPRCVPDDVRSPWPASADPSCVGLPVVPDSRCRAGVVKGMRLHSFTLTRVPVHVPVLVQSNIRLMKKLTECNLTIKWWMLKNNRKLIRVIEKQSYDEMTVVKICLLLQLA